MYGAPPSYDDLGLEIDADFDHKASRNLQGVLERMNISRTFSSRLRSIQHCRIIFILDDSGSMNCRSDDTSTDEFGNTSHRHMTRWDELKQFVRDAIDIYGSLSLGGVDVYFLNRAPVLNVKVFSQLADAFSYVPERNDLTPLSATLRKVINDTQMSDARKIVVNIVTDGAPRSMDGMDDMKTFRRVLATIPHHMYVNIRLCTDEDDVVDEYNDIDTGLPRIDVNDDYAKESAEVLRHKHIRMTRGEYLLKATVGAADDTKGSDNFDHWDEHGHFCTIL